jgi:hypothetical protein
MPTLRLLICLAVLLTGGPGRAQTIYNPSFESNTFTVFPGYCSNNTAIAGWPASAAAQAGLNPAAGNPFANNGATPDGTNVAFIQTVAGATNSLATTISNLTAGTRYRVSCRVNSRTNYSLPTLWLAVNGVLAYSNTVPPVGISGNTSAPYAFAYGVFTAASNTAPLAVSCTSVLTNISGTVDGAVLLDAFQIAALPTNYFTLTPWTGDASAGVDATNTLWACAFAASTTNAINGVTFTAIAGGSPAAAGAFAVTGDSSTYTGETPDNLSGTGSGALAANFVYGGNPATVTVSNLTAGASYRLTLYGVGFDLPGNRYATFAGIGDVLYLDEDLYGQGNGLRVDYNFTASAATTVVTITPANSGSTFHLHGLALAKTAAASTSQTSVLPLYYCTSSSILASNTVVCAVTNGASQTTLLTASGVINRCTALAVDPVNDKLFLADAQTKAIYKANLDGSSLTQIKSGLTAAPTDLALDVSNALVYFTTSSTIHTNNTIQRMDYSGNNLTNLLTAGVAPAAGVARCTALAVDAPNGKLFLADAAGTLWSLNLSSGSLASLAAVSGSIPTGLALDAASQQVYFSVSYTVQASNTIRRVSYSGNDSATLFTASGSVQRCTALALDSANGVIYLSDAGAASLWRIPLASGTPAAVLSLPAMAKKVRWFNAPVAPRPRPILTGLQFTGAGGASNTTTNFNLVLSATNGCSGGTYYLLTSSNLAAPLSQWQPIATNILGSDGSFSLTASNLTEQPCQFYLLRVQ